jgi:hypothetical protein
MLRRVALVRTDVSEEISVSIIRVTRIGKLGTTLAVTSNRRTLRRNTKYCILYVGLERGPLSLVMINEALLQRKVVAPV